MRRDSGLGGLQVPRVQDVFRVQGFFPGCFALLSQRLSFEGFGSIFSGFPDLCLAVLAGEEGCVRVCARESREEP